MDESDLWQKLKSCSKHLAHIFRIENSIHLGTPDVNGCRNGIDFWIELKYLEKWPKLLKIDHFTEQQKIFLVERGRHGGNAFLLVHVGKDFLLFDWPEALQIHTYDRDAAIKNAIWHQYSMRGILDAIQNHATR